ncbi:MAG: ABC transporter substrate-binding protein [Actinobacteria bacterium]|nr:ABC transporter substrate-binding protein [Actinomycetota bacterium]
MECKSRTYGARYKRRGRRLVPLAVLLLLSAIALLAALALGGCGSSDSGSSGNATTATEQTIEVGGPDTEKASITVTSDPALNAMLPDAIKSSGKIKVAMNVPYPPWEYYESPGSDVFVGIEPDIAKALGVILGADLVLAQTPFDGIIASILAGKADLGISTFYDTADRQKVVDIVDYAQDGSGILVLKGNPEGITGVDDLSGKVVSVQKGTTQYEFMIKKNQEFVAAGKEEIKILALPNDTDAQLAVKSGKAVANMTDGPGGAYVAKTNGGGTVFEALIDPAFPGGYDPSTIAILVKKDYGDLAKALQQALQQMVDDGSMKQILDLYGAGQSLLDPITINLGVS